MFELKLQNDWLEYKGVHHKESRVRFVLPDFLRQFESDSEGICFYDQRYERVLWSLKNMSENERKEYYNENYQTVEDAIALLMKVSENEANNSTKDIMKQFLLPVYNGGFKSKNFFEFHSKI